MRNTDKRRGLERLVWGLGIGGVAVTLAWGQGLTRYEMRGQAVASQFDWAVKATVSAVAGQTGTITFDTASLTLPDGPAYEPWQPGVPVQIEDGPATETVIIAASSCAVNGTGACSATARFAYAHAGRVTVSSASDGLQEAIDYLEPAGGTVILTPDWRGSAAALAQASGSAAVQIEDTRAGSVSWYGWSGGGYTPATSLGPGGSGLVARIVNQVRNAAEYPGADIGAQVNAAIASLGPSGGEVVIPAGNWSYTTPIVIPRAVSVVGQGGFNHLGASAGGSVLEFTGSGCAVVVGDVNGPSGQPPQFGAAETRGLVLIGNAGGSIESGRYGLCLGEDPNADGSYWASLGALSAYGYRFRNLEISGFDHGVEWGSNAFNIGFSGMMIDDNNIGTTEAAGIADSNSNNWFTRSVWYGNSGGALVQPSGGMPQGAAISCAQCDFEWNNNLSDSSTSAASAPPQVTGGMICMECHFEAWGGLAWQTSGNMPNPRVVLIGGFYGADSAAITDDPAAFSFAGAGAGPQVTILDLYLNTAHTVGEGVACAELGSNPECDIEALPLAGGSFTQLVDTAVAGGTGLFPGSYVSLPAYGVWQSGSPLTIGVSAGDEGLALKPSQQSGPAAAGPGFDLYAWDGSGLAEYEQFVDSAGNWNLFKVGGGGNYLFNGMATASAFASSQASPAATGALRLANTDLIAWRNAGNNGDLTLSAPATSGQAAVTSQLAVSGALTTTAAASDTATVPGVTASSHCVVAATNAAGAALSGVFIAAVGANTVTVAHAATAGATFNILCTPN